MHGLKAVNFYMLVERERWQGSPITRDNRIRRRYADFYCQLTRFLHENSFHRFRKQTNVLLLLNFDAGRLHRLAQVLDWTGFVPWLSGFTLLGVPPELRRVPPERLGLQHDILTHTGNYAHHYAPEWGNGWFGRILATMEKAFIPYNLADTHLPAKRMRDYRLVCVPTFEFMDTAEQENLLRYVEEGGRLVIGPDLPTLDVRMQHTAVLKRHLHIPGETVTLGSGTLTWLLLDQITLEAVCGPLDLHPLFYANPPIELSLHNDGERSILFAANPTANPVDTDVCFGGRYTFIDLWDDTLMLTGNCTVRVTLPAYTIRLWEVTQ